MNHEPKHEAVLRPNYFADLTIDAVLNWMGVLYYSERDMEIVRSYFEQRDQQNFEEIAHSLELSAGSLDDVLKDVDQHVFEARKQTKKDNRQQREAISSSQEEQKSFGSVVLNVAAYDRIHPSMQQTEGININERFACKDLKPSKRDKFTSNNVKEQQEAAQRCLHCEIRKKCGRMAVEMGFANDVYGAMTGKQLQAKIRQNKRQDDSKKKKKK